MNPFNLFLILVAVGMVLFMGSVVVNDCSDPELVVYQGTIVDKTTDVEQVEKEIVVGGCPVCPGSKTRLVRVTEEEPVFLVLVEVSEGEGTRVFAFPVSEDTYRRAEIGERVTVRVLKGRVRGLNCTQPELEFAEP